MFFCCFLLLEQWFSTLLKLWPFNTALRVVVAPTIQLSSLLLQNCCFAVVMNCNVSSWYGGYLIYDPPRGSLPTGWEPALEEGRLIKLYPLLSYFYSYLVLFSKLKGRFLRAGDLRPLLTPRSSATPARVTSVLRVTDDSATVGLLHGPTTSEFLEVQCLFQSSQIESLLEGNYTSFWTLGCNCTQMS